MSGHSLSEGITPAHPLPFLAVYMRGKVVCATKKSPYGTPLDEAEVAITPPLLPGYPNMTAHWRSLPICQGLADNEVPPLLHRPFGPIGWNGWGEKKHRQ